MPAQAQAAQASHAGWSAVALICLITAVAACYVVLVIAQRRAQRPWSRRRTAAFLSGAALVAWALDPELVPFPTGDFREHMLQHLVIAMLAPLLLVLGAPVTLVLRCIPARHGRWIVRLLKSWPAAVLAHPVVALALNLGGMAALYFTPLYALVHHSPALHFAVHLHFLLAGCLFAWVIAGPDPAPHRPSVQTRLVILGVAIFLHASISQLLYAGWGVAVTAPESQRRGGAELMYYGGDITELLLAFALVSTWRPRGRAAVRAPERPFS